MLDVLFGDVISSDRKKNPLLCCIIKKSYSAMILSVTERKSITVLET